MNRSKLVFFETYVRGGFPRLVFIADLSTLMKPLLLPLATLLALCLAACDTIESPASQSAPAEASLAPPVSSDAVSFALATRLFPEGVTEPISWETVSTQDLWDHIASLDSTLTVGLRTPGTQAGVGADGRPLLPEAA